MRPTEYLTHWSARDRGLAEALLLHDEALDPHGIPWDEAMDPESDGRYAVEERVSYPQAVMDQWERDHREDRQPGVIPIVIDVRAEREKARRKRDSRSSP